MGIEDFLIEEEKILNQYIIFNEHNVENKEIRDLFIEKLKDYKNNLLNYQNIIDKWIEELKDEKYINIHNLLKKVTCERERMIYLNKIKNYNYDDIMNEIKVMIDSGMDNNSLKEFMENSKILFDNDYLYDSIIKDEDKNYIEVEEYEEDYDY
jgi:hypothetical protein